MDVSVNDELFDPPQRNDDSDDYDIIEPGFAFHMASSNTDRGMGPIQHYRYRTFGMHGREEVDELSAIFVATQAQGPFLGKKAVMKLKIQ